MAVNKGKSPRSALGGNPLAQGIFSKTEVETPAPAELTEIQESRINNQEDRLNSIDSTVKNKESRKIISV